MVEQEIPRQNWICQYMSSDQTPCWRGEKIEKRSYYGTQLPRDFYITRIPMNKPVYTIEC